MWTRDLYNEGNEARGVEKLGFLTSYGGDEVDLGIPNKTNYVESVVTKAASKVNVMERPRLICGLDSMHRAEGPL